MRTAPLFLLALASAAAAPASDKKPIRTLEFLKRFGYLESRDGEGEILESLYTEETVAQALQQVQKFGGLPQTGILDNDTEKLIGSRRCGLPDVLRGPPVTRRRRFHRQKRFAITSGWHRRHLTYYLGNWNANLNPHEVRRELARAFQTWGKYSRLTFSEASTPNADILIGFYRGNHQDMYPFEGPGWTLAHAFFPNNGTGLGGDIHFDDDEQWKINLRPNENGVDFGAVALHEIGHSLGLSHSPEQGSVMNPYYKGGNMELGYDDILAMYELYIKRRLAGDNEGRWEEWDRTRTAERTTERITTNRPTTSATTTKRPTTPRMPTWRVFTGRPPTRPTTTRTTTRRSWPSTTERWRERGYQGDDESVETHKGHDDKHRVPPTELPSNSSACFGHFSTVANIREELYIIKGQILWRLEGPGKIMDGFPVKIHQFFHKLPPSVKYIDAIYLRPDSNITFFTGSKYWVFNGYDFIEDSPRPISDYGLPSHTRKIDAVMLWPKNFKTYIFKDDKYWRYDDMTRSVEPGYPKQVSMFKGVPEGVDAALTWKDGATYFFKDDNYWQFDDETIAVRQGYPRSASDDWLGC